METFGHEQIIEIDRETLSVVLEALSYMIENYYDSEKIDKTEILVSFDDLKKIFDKLNSQEFRDQESVSVPMNSHDWSSYTGLILYASRGLPGQSVEHTRLLDDLSDQYFEWEEEDITTLLRNLKETDFPEGTKFIIRELDVPIANIPAKGWFNWYGGRPSEYDSSRLSSTNHDVVDFLEWKKIVIDSFN